MPQHAPQNQSTHAARVHTMHTKKQQAARCTPIIALNPHCCVPSSRCLGWPPLVCDHLFEARPRARTCAALCCAVCCAVLHPVAIFQSARCAHTRTHSHTHAHTHCTHACTTNIAAAVARTRSYDTHLSEPPFVLHTPRRLNLLGHACRAARRALPFRTYRMDPFFPMTSLAESRLWVWVCTHFSGARRAAASSAL